MDNPRPDLELDLAAELGANAGTSIQQLTLYKPTIVYSYINEGFSQHLPELRAFVHDLGRETNQGEVAFEFDGIFYRISEYDRSRK